jgi:sulfofructose kinase
MSSSLRVVDLVGVGLNAADTVIAIDRYPDRGSKIGYRDETIMPGGQVASTVVACAQWGLSARYVGKLGADDAARLHHLEFEQSGVDARIVTVPGAASHKSLILVDHEGERTVFGRRDPRLTLQPEELQREWIVNARALHVDGYDTAAATLAATWAHEAGIPVLADIDEPYPGVNALLEKIDYLIVSRTFPAMLMGGLEGGDALRTMHARFGNVLSASTLGPGGVLAWDGRQFFYNAAYDVPVVDSTGAGDAFHSGFIFGHLQGWPLDRVLDFSCAAAALNCMAVGARGGTGTVAAIEELRRTTSRHPAPDFVAPLLSIPA